MDGWSDTPPATTDRARIGTTSSRSTSSCVAPPPICSANVATSSRPARSPGSSRVRITCWSTSPATTSSGGRCSAPVSSPGPRRRRRCDCYTSRTPSASSRVALTRSVRDASKGSSENYERPKRSTMPSSTRGSPTSSGSPGEPSSTATTSSRASACIRPSRPSLACSAPTRAPATSPRWHASAGVSPSHLSRLFKSQTGTSITRFRNQQRVQRFMLLYRDGRHTTALAAALEAGFGSYAQFYRVFRAETGGRPSLSRTEHRPPAVDDRRAAHDQVMADEPEGRHWTPEEVRREENP